MRAFRSPRREKSSLYRPTYLFIQDGDCAELSISLGGTSGGFSGWAEWARAHPSFPTNPKI